MSAPSTPSAGLPALKVLMLGSVSLDELERSGQRRAAFGGAVCYGGAAAAADGCRVDVAVHVPSDVQQDLRRAYPQLHWHMLSAGRATRFVNIEAELGPRQQRCTDRAPVFSAAHLPDGQWDWVHCGPLHARDLSGDLLIALRRQAQVISLDVQGLLRSIDAQGRVRLDGASLDPEDLQAWLEGVDWLKASEREWRVLHQIFGVAPDKTCAHWNWKGLLVSRGRAGGRLFGRTRHWDWSPNPGPVDGLETGAGDVFLAAFMARYLQGARTLELPSRKPGPAFASVSPELHDPGAALTHAAARAVALVASREG
jgi:sugar/nucleoside kinase (ribokinase family)